MWQTGTSQRISLRTAGSPVGQVIPESAFSAEQVTHGGDGPNIPPSDVAVLFRGDCRLHHPCVHGVLDVGVSDSGQTCGTGGMETSEQSQFSDPLPRTSVFSSTHP